MKEHDLLEAIGNLPEETVKKYALPKAKNLDERNQAAGKERITMKTSGEKTKKPIRIHMGAAAAVVALCVGLNVAIFYGISKMRPHDGGGLTPGMAMSDVQDMDQPHMELVDAMPTAVSVTMINNSDADLPIGENFSVWQDGEKVTDCGRNTDEPDPVTNVPAQTDSYQCIFTFEQLPAGHYMLCDVAEDNEHLGDFGYLYFDISEEYNDMIHVAEYRGEDYETVEAELQALGFQIDKRSAFFQGSEEDAIEAGKVISVSPEPYKSEEVENGTTAYYHYDGSGYWTPQGSTVTVLVSLGAQEGATIVQVPDVVGWDFETAKTTLLNRGLYVDVRRCYYDDLPEGKVGSEIVGDHEFDGSGNGYETKSGSYVQLYVSLGQCPDTVPLPDFTGMNFEEARELLESFGMYAARNDVPSDEPAGTVIAQTPVPSEETPEASVVTLDVARDPNETAFYIEFDIPAGVEGQYRFTAFTDNNVEMSSEILELNGLGGIGTFPVHGTEQNLEIKLYVTNLDTDKEYPIGSYLLHFDSETYEPVSVDAEAAFKEVQ